MHLNILSKSQVQLLPLIERFSDRFYLVGGTAIALHLGHRRSIDFDLFSGVGFDNQEILKMVKKDWLIQERFIDSKDELTIVVNGVKITWYNYAYKIDCLDSLQKVIKLPNLVTLAAMKAYALGRSAKWKDYVDLYFIFQKHSLNEVVKSARKIFDNEFNEKLFREQLAYHKDIDYSEPIEYLGAHPTNRTIRGELVDISLK